MSLRARVGPWLPPRVKDLLATSRWSGAIRYVGPYPDWAAAVADAGGYDAEVIAERCLQAALSVRSGVVDFERDTVGYAQQELPMPAAVAALLLAARLTPGRVVVIDFGGSMGSLYYRCRPWWPLLGKLTWIVVEQAGLTDRGNRHLADGTLAFVDSLEAAVAIAGPPSLVVASVLPYLEHPLDTLASLAALGAPVLCLDRTQTAHDDVERCFVQHVPKAIYPASYPMRFLSWAGLVETLGRVTSWSPHFEAEDGRIRSGHHLADYRGGIWRRRPVGPTHVSS